MVLWPAVLTQVFLGGLLALVALGVWGWHVGGSQPLALVLAGTAPVAAATVWGLFAAPRAQHGGRLVTPVTKVLVLGGASLGLWDSGYAVWALGLLGLNLVANLAASHPRARALARPKPTADG